MSPTPPTPIPTPVRRPRRQLRRQLRQPTRLPSQRQRQCRADIRADTANIGADVTHRIARHHPLRLQHRLDPARPASGTRAMCEPPVRAGRTRCRMVKKSLA